VNQPINEIQDAQVNEIQDAQASESMDAPVSESGNNTNPVVSPVESNVEPNVAPNVESNVEPNVAPATEPKAPKKHSVFYSIWTVLYPLFLFLGIQVAAGVFVVIFYLFTVTFPQANMGIDPVVAARQMQDFIISKSTWFVLVCDGLILPLFIFMYLRQIKGKRRPVLSSFKISDYLLVAALAVFADFAVTYIIIAFNLAQYFPDYEALMGGIVNSPLILQIIAVGIVAPVVEEFLMRGVILNRLLGFVRVLPAVIIQAVLFGVIHLNLLQGMYAALLGLLMGYLYVKYGSILMTIVFHITLNTLSVVLPESFGAGLNPFAILIPAILLTNGTLWLINRRDNSKLYIRDAKAETVLQEK